MLIVISDSTFLTGEAATVSALLRAGLDVFHIRKYGCAKKALLDYIKAIPVEFRNRLVLHHDHELGRELGLTRFHFSEQDRLAWQKKNWVGVDAQSTYSTSVHSLIEFNELPAHFDYAFISPVFDSISKQDYKAEKFDLSERTNEVAKLIALGGINALNAQQAMTWGFDGVALLGAIWKNEQPISEFEQFLGQLTANIVIKS